jgi:hypothetical protein
MSKRIAVAFISLVIACQAFAVKAASSPQQQAAPAPTGLALEVTYYEGRPPAYQTVPGPEAKLNGAWYGMFRSVPSWQPPANSLPVQAINILSRLEGDSVRIEVSVLSGKEFPDKETPVATYRVHVNEKISARELTRFGAEPIEIKVVRVDPLLINPPAIVNKTDSIAVFDVKVNTSTLPTYTLTVRNLSGKSVDALGIKVMVDGRARNSSLRRGKQGQHLIEAGATEEIFLHGAELARKTSEGYSPDSLPNQEIHINTVVFADGSYEGEVETAAQVRGFEFGNQIQIARLIPLLQEALNSTGSETFESLKRLKTLADSLSTDIGQAAVDELSKEFPALNQEGKPNLKIAIEVSLAGIKTDFLKDIGDFEKASAQSISANALRAWLSANKEKYEKWLSRINAE